MLFDLLIYMQSLVRFPMVCQQKSVAGQRKAGRKTGRDGLLPEKEIHDEAQDDADQDAGGERKVKCKILAFYIDVPGQAAQPGDFACKEEHQAHQGDKCSKKDENFAETGKIHLRFAQLRISEIWVRKSEPSMPVYRRQFTLHRYAGPLKPTEVHFESTTACCFTALSALPYPRGV